MKTALIQMDIVLGDVEANRKKALSMMEQGLRSGAELFVLAGDVDDGLQTRSDS